MKFIPILVNEGRKEDLQKKYSNKFKEHGENLSTILNSSDLADTNFKYADFVLKNLHPNSSIEEIEDAIELVKDFNRYQSELQKKDINQYQSFNELISSLTPFHEKEDEKRLSGQVDRIYEDNRFLVVKPKTEEASCKYGSNTKWCVTSKGSGHFNRYTSNNQSLYFIINKQNSTNQNYSKVAIHFNNEGRMMYWNSQDTPLTDREVDVLEYAFPEVIESIKTDYEKITMSKVDEFLKQVFNENNEKIAQYENYLSSKSNLEVSVVGFDNAEGMPGHATGSLAIWLTYPNDKHMLVDGYEIYIIYNTINDKSFEANITFVGDDDLTDEGIEDLGLDNFKIDVSYRIAETPHITANGVRAHIANRVLDHIKKNPKLVQKIIGKSKVWLPNKSSYGYTFKQNKGLINSLVNWVDSGNKGTKLDFLESIGKLTSKIDNGKKLYSNGGEFSPSSQWRGHFSSFFASAKLAGIIQYSKVGNKFIINKGPNFEDFKGGKLKAV